MKIQLDPPLSANEISDALGVTFCGDISRRFTHLATSSDECDAMTLFIALEGKRRHGNEFIPTLARCGVASVGSVSCINTFRVPSGLDALMRLAAYRKEGLRHLCTTVGITGSFGKTTTKNATALMLSQKFRVHKTPENLNSEIGLSLSILAAPSDTEVLVLELGINHPREMSRLSALARPDVAVITNIGLSHIGNFESPEALAREKARILSEETRVLLLGKDNPFPPCFDGIRHVGEGGVYQLLPLDAEKWLFLHPNGTLSLRLSPIEKDIESALVFALSVGRELGLSDIELTEGACKASRLEGRRHVETVRGITVIDDSYNASYESVDLALSVLCRNSGRRFAVLSDVLELGSHAEQIHEKIGALIAKYAPDGVYFLGEHAESVQRGAARFGYDTKKLVALHSGEHERCSRLLSQTLTEGDTLLLKGSHGGELWRIGEHLSAFLKSHANNNQGARV